MNERSFQYTLESADREERIIRGTIHYAAAQEPRGTVVLLHGFKGFKDWGMFPYVAQRLAQSADVIRFNMSRAGVGASLTEFDELSKFGRQTISGDLEDLGSLLDRLRSGTLPIDGGRAPASQQVILLGHSRGGGEALVWALDHPEAVAGVITWNGTVRFEDMFGEKELQTMREQGVAMIHNARTGQQMPLERVIADDLLLYRERYDIVSRIIELSVPALLIQGGQDFERLVRGSELLAERNRSLERVIIEGGDHTFGGKHPFQGTTAALDAAIAVALERIERWLAAS